METICERCERLDYQKLKDERNRFYMLIEKECYLRGIEGTPEEKITAYERQIKKEVWKMDHPEPRSRRRNGPVEQKHSKYHGIEGV